MSLDLDTQVRRRLEARRGEWQDIAHRAEVSHSWISQFVRGKIDNPGIETLRNVMRAMSEQPRRKRSSKVSA